MIDLAVCAIVRNEADIIQEWLRFHRAQGVQRFYIYDNDSTDATLSLLRDALTSEDSLFAWPRRPGQLAAYTDAVRRFRDDAKWIAFLDADEFLYSPAGASISTALSTIARADDPAVVVNWRVFGSDHERAPREGVVRGLTRRAPDDYFTNTHVKSIVRPRLVTDVPDPHSFVYSTWQRPVGENRDRVTGPFREPATANLLRINHYFVRSRQHAQAKAQQERSDNGTLRHISTLTDPALVSVDDDRSILKACPWISH